MLQLSSRNGTLTVTWNSKNARKQKILSIIDRSRLRLGISRPTWGNEETDKEIFVLVLEALHHALKPLGKSLTIAVDASEKIASISYDIPECLSMSNLSTWCLTICIALGTTKQVWRLLKFTRKFSSAKFIPIRDPRSALCKLNWWR